MPELPDVEIFKRLVDEHCLGRVIERVEIADPGSVDSASLPDIQKTLTGSRILAAHRYGKYLIIDCAGAGSLLMHFGPNGSLRFIAGNGADTRYLRLSLVLQHGDRLAYINPRRIGRVRLVANAAQFVAEARLGPDAMDPDFDASAFAALLASRQQPVKAVLMDQARVAGIGNTYSDEILFQARLHPAVIAARLRRSEADRLFATMRSVLQVAIDQRAGAEDFVDRLPEGFLLPQRHPGGRCPRCGSALQIGKTAGRTGYFCPKCQPDPAR